MPNMRGPLKAVAVKGTTVKIRTPRKLMPIVFVPGILGTRLTDPETGDLVWNPTGSPLGNSPGSFAVDVTRLGQISQVLEPDESHWFRSRAKHQQIAHIRHYYNIIEDFYGNTVRSLANIKTAPFVERGVQPVVYVCGYDWRQDNAQSALRLGRIVDEALAETGADQVVLVCHSMGGMVARYFCKVLGGESRVHQIVLIGSPTMGSPFAYHQLKLGVKSFYVANIVQHILGITQRRTENLGENDSVDWISDGGEFIAAMTRLIGAGLEDSEFGGMGALKSIFGDVYLALSIGAGKMLSRRESLEFIRTVPSVYQLLPNSIFCDYYPNWLTFSPLSTGIDPVGDLVTIDGPSVAMVAPGIASTLESVTSSLASALDPRPAPNAEAVAAEHESKRSLKRKVSLATVVAHAAGDSPDLGALVLDAKAVYARLSQAFVDCRNHEALYRDIYVGILDGPQLRPMTAANLERAMVFQRLLIENYAVEPPKTLLNVGGAMLSWIGRQFGSGVSAAGRFLGVGDVAGPVGQFFESAGSALASLPRGAAAAMQRGIRRLQAGRPTDAEELHENLDTPQERAAMRAIHAARLAEAERNRPTAYMHPNTVNLYVSNFRQEFGAVVIPIDAISRDDSNLVKFQILPTGLISLLAPRPRPAGWIHQIGRGDGTVPNFSANPPAEALSHNFRGVYRFVRYAHGSQANARPLRDRFVRLIGENLAAWYEGRPGTETEYTQSQPSDFVGERVSQQRARELQAEWANNP